MTERVSIREVGPARRAAERGRRSRPTAKVAAARRAVRHRRAPDRGGLLRAPEGDPADGRRRRGVGGAPRSARACATRALVPNSRGAAAGARRRVHARSRWSCRPATPTTAATSTGRTDESLDDIAGLIDAAARRRRARAEVIVATSFGCPYEGDVDPARVAGDRRPGASPTAPTGSRSATPPAWRRRAGCASWSTRSATGTRTCRCCCTSTTPAAPALANILTALELGDHRVRRERRRARRLPVRAGRHAATWPPRRSCTCCTTWASTPASTSTR